MLSTLRTASLCSPPTVVPVGFVEDRIVSDRQSQTAPEKKAMGLIYDQGQGQGQSNGE